MTPSPRLLLTIDYESWFAPSRKYDLLSSQERRKLDDGFAYNVLEPILEKLKDAITSFYLVGELVEPLALVFMHFDPSDLEDAAALVAVIETLEPPTDLAEAVQDIVRALMLMADVTRPRVVARRPGPPRRAPAGKRRR